MKTGMRWVAYAIVVVGPLGLGAQGGGRPPGRGGPPPEQRLGQVMRNQLGLSDAQAARLQESLGRFGERRRSLNDEERQSRGQMRELLCSADTTRGADLNRAIEQFVDVQKRRVQLLDDEQRDLAGFLTPYQRARFLGLSERIGEVLGGRAGPPPRGGPPPGGGPPRGARAGGDRAGGDRVGPPPGGPGRGRPPVGDPCAPPGDG